MEDLPLGRIAALVPEFAVKDLPLGRTLMMINLRGDICLLQHGPFGVVSRHPDRVKM